MDVFGAALGVSGQFLRDAAIDAAFELGVIDALAEPRTIAELAVAIDVRPRRLRALVDVLVALGVLARDGDRCARGSVPERPTVPRAGWGLLADAIRTDRALPVEGGEQERRMHRHLAEAGAAAAHELMQQLPGVNLLDLGGGAGAYTAAFLDAHREARATLVDYPEVISLAREHLARFGDRVTFVAGDLRSVELHDDHDVVLLSNLLHLHGARACAQLCALASRAVAPGGVVVVKDLRVDDDRHGPIEGLLFALNMAIYTGEGDVYSAATIRGWLEAAGLTAVDERHLEVAPDAFVIAGTRRRSMRADEEAAIRSQISTRLAQVGPALEYPPSFERRLVYALWMLRDEQRAMFETHFLDTMPRLHVAQLAGTDEPGATFFHTPLLWEELPRMTRALERLYAQLDAAEVDGERVLGAPTAAAFRARTHTFAELFQRTHYGRSMPLLYGYPPDLAYFAQRGRELGLSTLATMDRYLTASMIHELCHFARERTALSTQLDECIGGWLGVHVWPDYAYPEDDRDDAIAESPWFAQIGQAFARVFGVGAIVRGQSGAAPWSDVLSPAFVRVAQRLCDDDWERRRTLHFLSDTRAPRPWVALALAAGAGHSLAGHTLASLDELPLGSLVIREDATFDAQIVADALRAMCLVSAPVAGSLRTRFVLADEIRIDANACAVTAGQRWYWLPPPVAGRIRARGFAGFTLRLGQRSGIVDAAAAICAATPGETSAYTLGPMLP